MLPNVVLAFVLIALTIAMPLVGIPLAVIALVVYVLRGVGKGVQEGIQAYHAPERKRDRIEALAREELEVEKAKARLLEAEAALESTRKKNS